MIRILSGIIINFAEREEQRLMCGVGHRTISILLVSVFVKNFEIENEYDILKADKHFQLPFEVIINEVPLL